MWIESVRKTTGRMVWILWRHGEPHKIGTCTCRGPYWSCQSMLFTDHHDKKCRRRRIIIRVRESFKCHKLDRELCCILSPVWEINLQIRSTNNPETRYSIKPRNWTSGTCQSVPGNYSGTVYTVLFATQPMHAVSQVAESAQLSEKSSDDIQNFLLSSTRNDIHHWINAFRN